MKRKVKVILAASLAVLLAGCSLWAVLQSGYYLLAKPNFVIKCPDGSGGITDDMSMHKVQKILGKPLEKESEPETKSKFLTYRQTILGKPAEACYEFRNGTLFSVYYVWENVEGGELFTQLVQSLRTTYENEEGFVFDPVEDNRKTGGEMTARIRISYGGPVEFAAVTQDGEYVTLEIIWLY